VIDYVMGDEEVKEKVWSMRVEDKIDSSSGSGTAERKGKKGKVGRREEGQE